MMANYSQLKIDNGSAAGGRGGARPSADTGDRRQHRRQCRHDSITDDRPSPGRRRQRRRRAVAAPTPAAGASAYGRAGASPTVVPTPAPTPEPTAVPSRTPTQAPTPKPSAVPAPLPARGRRQRRYRAATPGQHAPTPRPTATPTPRRRRPRRRTGPRRRRSAGASADERDGVNTAADARPDAGAVRESDGTIARRRMGHRQGGTDDVQR